MGLSSYPSPAYVEILCVLILEIANLGSRSKEMLISMLKFVGINPSKQQQLQESDSSTSSITRSNTTEYYSNSSNSDSPTEPKSCFGMEFEFEWIRNHIISYKSILSGGQEGGECSICIEEFGEGAFVHHLTCGHFFHASCMHTCLNYGYSTCPLCRTPIIQVKERNESWVFS